MKTLMMPVRSLPSTTPAARAKLHFRWSMKALQYVAAVTLALVFGLAATMVVASALALVLAIILGLIAASAAALVFMVVSPEGNLLLLLLLSQLWLLYAPRKREPRPEPHGGLTMKVQDRSPSRPQRSLAA